MPAGETIFAAAMAAVRRQAPALFALSLLANLLLLASSIYMLQVYDRVLTSGSVDTLVWLTAIALAAIATYAIIEQARSRLLARIGHWLDLELGKPVLERSLQARLAGAPGEAGLGDVADLRGFLGGEALLAFLDAPWVPAFIAVIWIIHPALALLAVFGGVLLFAGALANELLTRDKAQAGSVAMRRNHAAAQQVLDSAETVSALGMFGSVLARWQERQRQAHAFGLAATEATSTIVSMTRGLRLAMQVAILGLGALLVLQGEMTAGGMIAASIIMSRALAPIERSIGAWRKFMAARAAYRNLGRLFAAERDGRRLRLPRPRGELAVENLEFTPTGARRPVLSRINFTLAPGEACGILGPSGVGKSTLCRLLTGVWRPTAGCVRLDGAELASWHPDDLGRHVGYLPQQVTLFAGTIAENIARMHAADDEQVIAAARLAGVHEMILRLPDGYNTEVGVHGHRLSGGQRQRIGLARALFGEPVLVVLDEPASNLDGEGDEALHRALTLLKERGRTVLIVAHRPSALRSTDRLLVLRDGTLAAFGERDAILKAMMTGQRPSPPAAARAPVVPVPTLQTGRAAE